MPELKNNDNQNADPNANNQNNNKTEELEKQNAELTNRLGNLEEKLDDPAYIDSLYRSHFGQPNDNADSSSGNDKNEDPKPEFEKLDTANMTNEQVVAEMERRQNVLNDWNSRQVDKKFDQREQAQSKKEEEVARQQEIQTIRDFAEKTEDFKEHQARIRELYGRPMTIEESYKFSKWEKLANEAEKEGKKKPSTKSTQSTQPDNMNKTFETVKDGAKAAFDEVTQGTDRGSL